MKNIQGIELNEDNREELLPGFTPEFPYIATCARLDKYLNSVVPWHWHRTVELFYIESGCLEYTTPNGKWIFPAGSGGMVNSNVLHSSRIQQSENRAVQFLHLFDPVFLSGGHGSRMETKYILPMTTAPAIEMIVLDPKDQTQVEILNDIRQAFEISDQEWGYEFKLRESLANIWMKLFEVARPAMGGGYGNNNTDDKIKAIMVYIHEHFQESISVDQLAKYVHLSKRACFRLFQENLHMTPVEYIRSYRLQMACQMLAKGKESITQIAYTCGFGSSSYFGKIFHERFGCSPVQYRRKWHDCNILGHI